MYHTAKGESSAELTIKHSKFLAFSAHVSDEEEAENFVRGIKKRFSDATHAPYAYVLGERSDKFRASDDGEPSGTSGIPILEAIKNSGLTFTAVVVVRYFGGIKLGTGGLAHAYGDAAFSCLSSSEKTVFDLCTLFSLSCDYSLISVLQTQIFAFDGSILSADYGQGASLSVAIPAAKKEGFRSALMDATSGKVTMQEGEERFCEVKNEG